MITYSGKMNVNKHDFYETLLLQICADINEKTGRKLDLKSIKNGCRYKIKRKIGNKIIESIIEVKEPILDKKIETVNIKNGKEYSMTYEIEEINDNNIIVHYIQINANDNDGLITKMMIKHTTRKRLKAFEKYIKAKKDENEE